ncbi:hypothetical protein E4U09_006916 [Claviceps aff. purpurea]|uniref:Uncharacterized protein n=1 Tax=Claviceps aff. purpurea TaxID=1967640 RepID=A0A9P7TZW5_9HYPO|nr:hypothetical protein E4U09_006916 [Claviceps aff. purpurea]
MAPSFLKQLRRRSRASFRTDTSTDASSDGTNSQGTSPSSGSVTPPSVGHQSDPALDFQIKSSGSLRKIPKRTVSQSRTALSSVCSNSSNSRTSVSGMSGLGAPPVSGRDTVSLSQYAPRVHNILENSWVPWLAVSYLCEAVLQYGTTSFDMVFAVVHPLLKVIVRFIKKFFCSMAPLVSQGNTPLTAPLS